MILQWLFAVFFWMAKLIIPPGYWPSNEPPRIDPNAACPSCGNRDGRITTRKQPNNVMLVQHDCNICHATWFEKPIVGARNIIHTAPPPAVTK